MDESALAPLVYANAGDVMGHGYLQDPMGLVMGDSKVNSLTSGVSANMRLVLF